MIKRRWITVQEAAEYMNLHVKTIYRLTARRAIPFSKVDGIGIRIDKKRLDEKIENSEIEPQSWA